MISRKPQNLLFLAVVVGLMLVVMVQQARINFSAPRASQDEFIKLADFFSVRPLRPAQLVSEKFDPDFVLRILPQAQKSAKAPAQNSDLALDLLRKTPSLMPVRGYISSAFGLRSDPFSHQVKHHNGIDIAAPAGSPVFAPADGYVFTAHRNQSFGNMIEIMHECGLHTRYGHLDKILVSKGEKVIKGQIIGKVGNTGSRSRGAHLHYEVRHQNMALNPMNYLKGDA